MRKGFKGRNIWQIICVVFNEADTTSVRLILAVASAGFAILLVWQFVAHPFYEAFCVIGNLFQHQCGPYKELPRLFDRPAYALLAVVPGKEWTWAALFFLHYLGVHWRIIDTKESVPWGLTVNIFGFFLWTYSTVSLNIALGQILPGTALEWTMVMFSGWAMYRTGLKRELVTP